MTTLTPHGEPRCPGVSGEKWLPVVGASSYEVSDHGRVCSRRRPEPRILTPYGEPKADYLSVTITTDEGTRRQGRVHILVLEAFVGPRPAGHQTRHLDGDPGNNHLSNLRWGTASENAFDRVRHGTNLNARKTHCSHGHLFDAENTRVRRPGWRGCKECHRQLLRRRAALKAALKGAAS